MLGKSSLLVQCIIARSFETRNVYLTPRARSPKTQAVIRALRSRSRPLLMP